MGSERFEQIVLPPLSGARNRRSQFRFSALPALQPGETVLLVKKWVWATSTKSPPSRRIFCSLPPVCEAGLYITNRRVLVLASVFRLLTQEVSQWHAGFAEGGDSDVIRRVELGRSSLVGPYLDVVSTSAKKHWYRSPELRLRLYIRNAEEACRLIAECVDTAATAAI